MTAIENQYKVLAAAVIDRAIKDLSLPKIGHREVYSAKFFLSNSPELEMYADIAGVREDLEKCGYLRPIDSRH